MSLLQILTLDNKNEKDFLDSFRLTLVHSSKAPGGVVLACLFPALFYYSKLKNGSGNPPAQVNLWTTGGVKSLLATIRIGHRSEQMRGVFEQYDCPSLLQAYEQYLSYW